MKDVRRRALLEVYGSLLAEPATLGQSLGQQQCMTAAVHSIGWRGPGLVSARVMALGMEPRLSVSLNVC